MVLVKTLESPLDSRETKPSILQEINPEYTLKGLMLKLKLQYFGHVMQRTDSFEKTLGGPRRGPGSASSWATVAAVAVMPAGLGG